MIIKKKITMAAALLFLAFSFTAPPANAKGGEYKEIVNHLKTKYKAKKVSIPFMFLARFAVSVVRPAGVKSFSVTLFEDLKFSRESLDKEMQTAMRNSFGEDWSPIFHVRSRMGQQAYMYMREAGGNVKITLVTIDKNEAAVIRATFSPERLADFINDPKIFGISLDDKDKQTIKNVSDEKKPEELKKDN
ncbi:MAG: hypothetical protein ACR2HG_04880 [Pyrinomonadaceae bacterium]